MLITLAPRLWASVTAAVRSEIELELASTSAMRQFGQAAEAISMSKVASAAQFVDDAGG